MVSLISVFALIIGVKLCLEAFMVAAE